MTIWHFLANLKEPYHVKLPKFVEYFLSLGPKFSLPNTYLPAFKITPSIEKGISGLDHHVKDNKGKDL